MPKLEQFEIKKYWQIFSGLKPADNKVNHDQVLPILYNSKLDSSILNNIWFLADIDDDDSLDFEEFVICMRLIFDMVNKNIDKVPDELPDWLVPGSKSSLIKERRQRKQRENADIPKNEPPEVDWYISPEDLSQYGKILQSCELSTDGTVSFPSLSWAIKSKFFNVGSSDLEKVWKLVNPKNLPAIDKDPAFYFIHCLRQYNDVGARIPSELPRALADICNKERVSYDLHSTQADVKKTSPTPTNDVISHDNYRNSKINDSKKASHSSNNSTSDIAQLERELAELDEELAQVQAQNASSSSSSQTNTRLLREQFEGLLRYKQQQTLTQNNNTRVSVPVDNSAVKDDLDNIEEQINGLESYLNSRRSELQSLKTEIQNLH